MPENKEKEKVLLQGFKWKVLIIFSVILAIFCFAIFLFNYDDAYNVGAYFPSWLAVMFICYFLASFFAVIAVAVLDMIFQERMNAKSLFLCAIVLPIVCYFFNYFTLKKDGPLYSLVDDGGIFHFITIGDWNLDGENDEDHRMRCERREVSSRYGGHYDDGIINYIDTTATGVGLQLDSTFASYDYEIQTIELHLKKALAEYEQIKLDIKFKDSNYAENVSFYSNGEKLNHTVDGKTVEFVLDSELCEKRQNDSTGEDVVIYILYTFN